MAEEKIVVTSEECERIDMSSAALVSGDDVGVGCREEERKSWKGVAVGVLVVAFLLTVVGMVMYCISIEPTHRPEAPAVETASGFKESLIRDINATLEEPDNGMRKYIEAAHLSVKVSKAYVRDCELTTVDGSDRVGSDGANIDEVTVTIRFFWDGLVDRDGHTDLEIKVDVRGGKVLSSKIVETTAAVNVQDPEFWFHVGEALALCFL